MKNITLSADEKLIDAALERARAENTTLNELFHNWLREYVGQPDRVRRYQETMAELRGRVDTGGRKFTREEMNER